eukprot:gb/GECG01012965.1/.p1 GENE.gb/GECG01012965.1/~~gb/GECG01012965.1/.p1  ORF type:complete len:168 (+),score=22.70 gb/GECG01012965.1/:1-504(+)
MENPADISIHEVDPQEAPIPQTRISVDIETEKQSEGSKITEQVSIVAQQFTDKVVINVCAPQAKSFGSVLTIAPPNLTNVASAGIEEVQLETKGLLGESDNAGYEILATQIMRQMINCGTLKTLLLTVNLQEHQMAPRNLKKLVEGIKAEFLVGNKDASLKSQVAAT